MTLIKLIKEIGYRGDLTQGQIAQLIGVQQATISRLRRGVTGTSLRTMGELVKLAKKYNIEVSLEELLPMD